MVHTKNVALLALLGSAHGFLPASTGAMTRSLQPRTTSAIAPMRMVEANNPSGNIRRAGENLKQGDASAAGEHIKEAGKQALNKAENAADRALNKADQAGDRAGDRVSAAKADLRAVGTGNQQRVDEVSAQVSAENREVIREAPIVKERIHESTEIVDKTRVEEERIRTEVVQKIQPIKDEQRRSLDVKTVDHGVEVNHHGKSGLDAQATAELERRRQEVAKDAGTVRDVTQTKRSERPDVVTNETVNVIEQVVPVLERDVYVPHKVEHEKKVVEIYHEAPEVVGTKVEAAISKEEFEQRYGTKVATTAPNASASSSTVDIKKTQTGSVPATPATGTAAVRTSASSTTTGSKVPTNVSTTGVGATKASTDVGATGAGATKASHIETKHEEEAVPYSMSSSNMVKDAESVEHNEEGSSGGGIAAKVAAPFKAVGNLFKD